MGDNTPSLFKSMKAKLGMTSVKGKAQQQGHRRQGSCDVDQSGSSAKMQHPLRRGHSEPAHVNTKIKRTKSRESMLNAYRGTSVVLCCASLLDWSTHRFLLVSAICRVASSSEKC